MESISKKLVAQLNDYNRLNEQLHNELLTYIDAKFVEESQNIIDVSIPYKVAQFFKGINMVLEKSTLPEENLSMDTCIESLTNHSEEIDNALEKSSSLDDKFIAVGGNKGSMTISEVLISAEANIRYSGYIIYYYIRSAEMIKSMNEGTYKF